MKIMQINNNYPTQYNANFESRKVLLPKKWALREVSEDTLKKVSAAITSTGIASMLLGQSHDDYIESIATPIDRLDFSNEDMKVLEEGYEISPILMDTLLSAKDSYNGIRDFHKEQIEQLLPAYDINPDLTGELLIEKKDDGNFKYRIQDVINIVNANELAPELLEPAKKHPTFVNSLINATMTNLVTDLMTSFNTQNCMTLIKNLRPTYLSNTVKIIINVLMVAKRKPYINKKAINLCNIC